MSDKPYTNEELENLGNDFPDRGERCDKCHTRIPEFESFGPEQRQEFFRLFNAKNNVAGFKDASAYFKKITGGSERFVKIIAAHPNGPIKSGADGPGFFDPNSSCPYCGKALRTVRSKQCAHCLMDWHDQVNPCKL